MKKLEIQQSIIDLIAVEWNVVISLKSAEFIAETIISERIIQLEEMANNFGYKLVKI